MRQQFHEAKFMVDVDVDPGCTLNKKIRNAQLAQYNFILGKKGRLLKKICQTRKILKSWNLGLRIVVVSFVPSKSRFLNYYVYSVDIKKENFGVKKNNL